MHRGNKNEAGKVNSRLQYISVCQRQETAATAIILQDTVLLLELFGEITCC